MIYNYDGFVVEIKNRLSLLSDWNKILYYGVYQRIVDMLAYTADKLVYLAEFLYREAKWITAEKRNSLVKLAVWLGYVPYRKSGAIGTLQLSNDPTFNPLNIYTGKEVRVAKWNTFSNTDGTVNVYCTANSYYYTGFVGNLNIPVKEGIPKEFLYIASGVTNECIYIYSDTTDNNEIEVQIVDSSNNFLHSVNIVSNLYLVNDTVNYSCQIDNSDNYDSIKICFGDDINSKKLSIGERVLIKYVDTKGASGDISSIDNITVIKNILVDEDNLPVSFYVTNQSAIVGGSDIEDIESIRNNAPNIFQIGNVLSSLENWESVINGAPYVSKSKVWTAETLGGSTTVSDQNIVFITAVSSTGSELTVEQQDDLELNYIIPKKCLTEVLSFQPLQKVYAKFNITAKVRDTNTFSVITSAIKTALNNEYDILNTDFQTNIYESNFYRVIDSVSDVIYHETEVYYLENNINIIVANSKLVPSYTSTETADLDKQNYLMLDSFQIWIKRKIAGVWQAPLQIAYCSGVSIIGINDPITPQNYTISGGFVVYGSNQYSFSIDEIVADVTQVIFGVPDPGEADDLGYVISIAYKMEDGNIPAGQTNTIRLPLFYQITDIDVDYIDTDLSYI
jgi:hypothetical protein